jgi:hypothetical protein
MRVSSASAQCAQDQDEAAKLVRVALNSLSEGVEVAIRSAGDAYRFTPNSYTAGALSDAVALRSLMALTPLLAIRTVELTFGKYHVRPTERIEGNGR